MAAAFDAKSATVKSVSGVATLTISDLTVGSGTNRGLAVLIWFFSGTFPSGVTAAWHGQSMTQVPGTQIASGAASQSGAIYSLVAPDSGNNSLVINWTGNLEAHAVAISFSGVDQTSVAVAFPHGNTNTANSAGPMSVTITSATGNQVIAFHANGFSPQGATSGTIIQSDFAGPSIGVIGNYDNGAASVSLTSAVSGTGEWTSIGCDVLAAAGGGTADTPAGFKAGYWPQRWTRNAFLLHHRSSGPEASSAVETNTHFIPRALPPQWSLNRQLLLNRRAGPESSSATETNPHWQGGTWKSQWNINDSPNLLWNSTGDSPAAITSDDPTYFIPRSWPLQWSLRKALQQSTAQDFSSSAVETNPHWRGGSWPVQWTLSLALWRTIPQDFSSSAAETNPQWSGRPWLVQWLLTRALWQNAATDAQVVVIPPDAPTYFTPVQFPWQWVINLLLTTSPANDLTSPAVETNPQWTGRAYPKQWQPQTFLWQTTSTDVPAVVLVDTPASWQGRAWVALQWYQQLSLWRNPATDAPAVVDTPTYFVPRQFPLRWGINQLLRQGTAQDFSSSAVDTPSYANPKIWSSRWAARWNLNPLLMKGEAQDFSSVAPVVTSRPRVYIYT